MPHDPPPPSAIIVMGVSGSGKSTVAAALAGRLGWAFVDGDHFHPASSVETMRAGRPLSDADRGPWLRAIAAHIEATRRAGGRCVVACSALTRAHRAVLMEGRRDTRLVYLQGDRALIARRLARRRGHFMPPSLLDSQFAALEEPDPAEQAIVVPVALAPDAIVDAIVGQLARQSSAGRGRDR